LSDALGNVAVTFPVPFSDFPTVFFSHGLTGRVITIAVTSTALTGFTANMSELAPLIVLAHTHDIQIGSTPILAPIGLDATVSTLCVNPPNPPVNIPTSISGGGVILPAMVPVAFQGINWLAVNSV